MIPNPQPAPPPFPWLEPFGNGVGTVGLLLSMFGAVLLVAPLAVNGWASLFESGYLRTPACISFVVGVVLGLFTTILLVDNFAYLWGVLLVLPAALLVAWALRAALDALNSRL